MWRVLRPGSHPMDEHGVSPRTDDDRREDDMVRVPVVARWAIGLAVPILVLYLASQSSDQKDLDKRMTIVEQAQLWNGKQTIEALERIEGAQRELKQELQSIRDRPSADGNNTIQWLPNTPRFTP